MDLNAYFTRIGFDGTAELTPATLHELAAHHARAIPFENIDAFLGRRVSLDPAAVFDKLVRQRRGGWCFEQNLLLGEVLRTLGFDVTDLAGRVLWGRDADAITPRTHRALLVKTGGVQWLLDVGFGGQSLCGALDLARDDVQQVNHESFRFSRLGSDHLLSVRVRDAWLPMYRFDLQPQWNVDFEAANFQLVHDPESHFTQALALSLATEAGRIALRGQELTTRTQAVRGSHLIRRELRDGSAVVEALGTEFGLNLDAATGAALRAKLDQANSAA